MDLRRQRLEQHVSNMQVKPISLTASFLALAVAPDGAADAHLYQLDPFGGGQP